MVKNPPPPTPPHTRTQTLLHLVYSCLCKPHPNCYSWINVTSWQKRINKWFWLSFHFVMSENFNNNNKKKCSQNIIVPFQRKFFFSNYMNRFWNQRQILKHWRMLTSVHKKTGYKCNPSVLSFTPCYANTSMVAIFCRMSKLFLANQCKVGNIDNFFTQHAKILKHTCKYMTFLH